MFTKVNEYSHDVTSSRFFIIKMIPAKMTKRQNRQKGQISNLKNKEKVDAVKKGACHPPVNLVIDLK